VLELVDTACYCRRWFTHHEKLKGKSFILSLACPPKLYAKAGSKDFPCKNKTIKKTIRLNAVQITTKDIKFDKDEANER
jgi:hypothetical protein